MKLRFANIFAELLLIVSLLSSSAVFAHDFSAYGLNDTTQISGNIARAQIGLAIMENGEPATCFVDLANNNTLTYSTAENNWAAEDVEANLESNDECAIFFQQNVPHIIYSDKNQQQLKHATKVGDAWVISIIDDDFDINHNDITITRSFSAAISLNAARIAVAYHDGDVKDLKYAEHIDDAWNVETLVSDGDQGAWPALVFTQNNEPIIAFTKNWSGAAELWLIEESDGTWNAATQLDANGDAGSYTNLAIDGSNRLHLAYRATTDEKQELRYTFREDNLWQETIDVSSHSWNLFNAYYLRMTVDADGNAFFFYNWEFFSALFPDASYLEMASVYFTPEVGLQNYSSATDTISFNGLSNFYFNEAAIVLDSNYNMYLAWVADAEDNGYSLEIKKISGWKPAVTLLTPSVEENTVDAENQFTFRWLDFDPDSNAFLRLSWRDENWNYSVFADGLREDDVSEATVSVDALPTGDIPVAIKNSDEADFSRNQSMSIAPNTLSVAALVEDNPPAEDNEEEMVPAQEDASENDEPEINPLREDGQNSSDELAEVAGEESDDDSSSSDEQEELIAVAAAGGCQLQQSTTTPPFASMVILLGLLGFFSRMSKLKSHSRGFQRFLLVRSRLKISRSSAVS